MQTLGNRDILKLHKIAFLCSRQYPSGIVSKAYDWATELRNAGKCVLSGFHSPIEKDVFHFLLKGTQPIILALARSLPKRIDSDLISHLDKGRLLIVTPFDEKISRVTSRTAQVRNQLMVEIADEIVVGYAAPGGILAGIIYGNIGKPVTFLSG